MVRTRSKTRFPTLFALAMPWLFAIGAAQAVDGQLDPTFGDPAGAAFSGRTYAFWPTVDPLTSGWPMASGSVFKVLALGNGGLIAVSNVLTPYGFPYLAGHTMIGVTRRLASGQPDTAWGSDDPVIPGAKTGRALIYVGADYDWEGADALALQDGSVLIAGTVYNPDGSSDIAVWKLTASGITDTNFGSGGLKRLRRGGMPMDKGAAITPFSEDFENTVVVAATVRDMGGVGTLGAIIMSDTDGALCPSAGGIFCGNVVGGDVGLPSEWRMLRIPFTCAGAPSDVTIEAAVAGPFESTLAQDLAFAATYPSCLSGGSSAMLISTQVNFRLGSAGWQFVSAEITSYDSDPGYNIANARALAFDRSYSRYFLAGSVRNGVGHQLAAIAAFDTTLLPVVSGVDSASAVTFDMTTPSTPANAGDAYIDDLIVLPGGKLLAAGGFNPSTWAYGDALLARLNADLSFDASFGNYAASTPGRMAYGHPINGSDRDNRFTSFAFTPNGRVVAGGYAFATDTGAQYLSLMRVLPEDDRIFYNGVE